MYHETGCAVFITPGVWLVFVACKTSRLLNDSQHIYSSSSVNVSLLIQRAVNRSESSLLLFWMLQPAPLCLCSQGLFRGAFSGFWHAGLILLFKCTALFMFSAVEGGRMGERERGKEREGERGREGGRVVLLIDILLERAIGPGA